MPKNGWPRPRNTARAASRAAGRVVGFSDHARPVQLGRREVREGDEEPVYLEDLATLDDLGAHAFAFESRGDDAFGEVHPRMLPRR